MARKLKEGDFLRPKDLNDKVSRQDLMDMLLDLNKKTLEKFYTHDNLTEAEQLRKNEIEFAISYLEIDDLYENITSSGTE